MSIILGLFLGVSGELSPPCYIYDNYCMKNPTRTPDGNDPRKEPEKHGFKCLFQVPKCKESGYGLMCRVANSGNMYKNLFVFDSVGSTAATRFIETKLAGVSSNLCITVDATRSVADANGVMTLSDVSQFTRASGCNQIVDLSGNGTNNGGGDNTTGGPSGPIACTTGPNGQECQNSGKAEGTVGSCTCACMDGFSGELCEAVTGNNGGACTKSDLGRPELDCVLAAQPGKVSMHYGLNEEAETVSFCIVNEMGNGWVAFGPGVQMAGTQAVFAGDDQPIIVYDIASYDPPSVQNENFGLTETENSVLPDGRRRSCFTMPFAELNPAGAASVEAAKFVWAAGESTTFQYHGGDRGVINDFNFRNGSGGSTSVSVPDLIIVHIVCMVFAFLVFYPFGVLIAVHAGRGFAKGSKYFQMHRGAMIVAVLLTIVGVICALANSPFDTVHGYFGIFVSIFCIMQPVNGALRPAKEHRNRRKWEYLHKITGRVAVFFGLVTAILGAALFSNLGYEPDELLLVIAILFATIAILMWIALRCMQGKRDQNYADVRKGSNAADDAVVP